MKKGFITTLFAVTLFACASTLFAAAPVIRNLPDVTIGDMEDNTATDNNFFVFTNAYRFDDYVTDSDSAVTSLLWSFDELGGSTTQWYEVNGKAPMHIGDAAVAAADGLTSNAPHLAPPAGNELRQVANGGSEYASFRDIVFSPTAGILPFPTPVDPDKSAHEAGKSVRFFVSDGTNVVFNDCIVNTLDQGYDALTGTSPFHPDQIDDFTTNVVTPAGSPNGWSQLGLTTNAQAPLYPNGLVAYDWDSANSSLRGLVYSSATDTVANMRYRAAGWYCNQTEWLRHAVIGSTNYVRAKYYIYASPPPAGTMAENAIPNFRAGLAYRFAMTQQLECFHHDSTDWANYNWSREVRPTTDPTRPSLYRVDLSPIAVPYLVANQHFEGVLRRFDAFALQLHDVGRICCTEAVIGHYPKSVVDSAETTLQTYNPADLASFVPAAEQSSFNYYYGPGAVEGMYPNQETTAGLIGTVSNGGMTLDTTNVTSDKIGVVTRNMNPDQNTNNYATHPRVEEGKQYKIRFHVTSTQQTNLQAAISLRTRSIKFAWSYKLELAGAFATGGNYVTPGANNSIAQQAIPGVGCQNPDKNASENGGWYTVFLHTPLSPDIRKEFADGTPVSTSMPNISTLPGPGVASESRRDIRVGVDLVDTLDYNPGYATNERGNMTVDQIIVRSAPLVDDGGY